MPDLSTLAAPAATAQFEAIYRDHSRQITNYIAAHLHRGDHHLAEDLTAETFTSLWRSLLAGLVIEKPRGLLNTIATRVIAQHFRLRRAWEMPVDLSSPDERDVTAPGAAPHLAALLDELEDAKEHLAQAAADYKVMTTRAAAAQAALANSVQPESVQRATIRAARTAQLRDAALIDFQLCAERVAQLRAEWNGTALEAHGNAEPLPQREPGETFRKPPATVGKPGPVPAPQGAAA